MRDAGFGRSSEFLQHACNGIARVRHAARMAAIQLPPLMSGQARLDRIVAELDLSGYLMRGTVADATMAKIADAYTDDSSVRSAGMKIRVR